MNILDSISDIEKELIIRIVDNYRCSYNKIKEDSKSIFNSPGCWLHSLFFDINFNENSCSISFTRKDGKLQATFVLKKENDSNVFFQRINLKKATFFEQIFFLKLLQQANLIFFEEDYDCGLHDFTEHSKHDLEKWDENGLKHYDIDIKNNEVFAFINKYYWAKVIPSTILQDFRDKKFKTVDARRHKTNRRLSIAGIITAILIALISPFLMSKCSNTHIEDKQHNEIIESIKNSRTIIITNPSKQDTIINNTKKI